MSIFRRKNACWEYSIYIPGKEKRLRGSTGTKSKEEALIIEQSLRMAAQKKGTAKSKIIALIDAILEDEHKQVRIPIADIATEALRIMKTKGRQNTEHTISLKKARIKMFASWCREKCPTYNDIRDIDKICAHLYSEHLASEGKSVKTRRNIIGDLSSLWSTIRIIHEVDNPWLGILPEGEQGRGESFTLDEARRIIEAGDKQGNGWGLASRIAACTGLRLGDVLRLRYEDIQDGIIQIIPSKTSKHKISVSVPLSDDLLKRIGTGTGLLLPILAKHYNPKSSRMTMPFSDVLRLAKVDDQKYTFHSWRHFFRTQLAELGVKDDIARKLGGWTLASTARRYDHSQRLGEVKAAINSVSNLI